MISIRQHMDTGSLTAVMQLESKKCIYFSLITYYMHWQNHIPCGSSPESFVLWAHYLNDKMQHNVSW